MPRSGHAPQRLPCAATYTTSSLRGCTTTAEMLRVFSRPARVHVRPASVDLYIPSPYDDDWPRGGASPVPTYTTFGSPGATAMAPIDPTRNCPSEMLRHVV